MAQERYGMSAEMVDVLSMKYYCYRSQYKNVEFKSLDEFLLWSRGKYDYGMVLQRKDKDGPISPQNCRWVKVIKSEAALSDLRLAAEQWEKFAAPIRKRYAEEIADIHRKQELEKMGAVFRYEHPDLVREGIVFEGSGSM